MLIKTKYKVQVNYDRTLGFVDSPYITKHFESVEQTLIHIKDLFKSDKNKDVEICFDFQTNKGIIKTYYKRLNNTMNLPFQIVSE